MSRDIKSNRIRRILVPVDGSENAFRATSFAIDLAKKYGAELVVIYALQLNQSLSYLGTYGMPTPQHIADMIQAAKKEADPWFDRIKKEADASTVKVKSEVIEAPLSIVGDIVTYAENNQFDIIVVGSRGRTGFKKILLGSIASGIVTYAHCPVLVTK
ncbi:universal stress protein UspA-like protein [Candidatus Nitrososphaera evergladensis SR1]|uniref:Universal stress protein UspA-like protein n=1 Tax=Candidatus Nitrososphaera evergladensis SR1 TaxID=1459636 RepID=A0A075MQ19_9ARCH|nr:universal stress protein [Candidatus Nitrososphaera evergladensis]AIF82957.1 universal stress protein UspA-like protein [Candidatus Nitrososphaera evergladensis SR1]